MCTPTFSAILRNICRPVRVTHLKRSLTLSGVELRTRPVPWSSEFPSNLTPYTCAFVLRAKPHFCDFRTIGPSELACHSAHGREAIRGFTKHQCPRPATSYLARSAPAL